MDKINNKGFTLVEVLAVVAIIAIIGLIAIPNVISSINTGKKASYNTMIGNIKIAAQTLFEEVENNGSLDGVSVSGNTMTTNLQVLIDNGFLSGTKGSGDTKKHIINPKNNKDMGNCSISIVKSVDANYKVTYNINNNSSDVEWCPTSVEYANN